MSGSRMVGKLTLPLALVAFLAPGAPLRAGVHPQGAVPATSLSDPQGFARSIGTASYLLKIGGETVAAFGDVTRNYQLHSIRKSIVGALVGIEVARNKISLNETLRELQISDYSPLSAEESEAQFVNLLNSNSGVYRPATYENERFDKVRPAPGSHKPGTNWFYSNWDFNVAGTIFQQKTHQSVCRAFLHNIAAPLALQDFSMDNCGWRYSERSRHPAYVFRMSARDLASFGELMRLGGKWGSKQIVPADWIARSTAPIADVSRPDGTPMPGVTYGLMWWTAHDGKAHFPGLDLDLGPGAFIASGTGTQLLIVAPARKLVFVHRADTDDPAGKAVSQDDVGRLLQLLLTRAFAQAS